MKDLQLKVEGSGSLFGHLAGVAWVQAVEFSM